MPVKKKEAIPKLGEPTKKEKTSLWQDFFDKKRKESIEKPEELRTPPKPSLKNNTKKKIKNSQSKPYRSRKKRKSPESYPVGFKQVFGLRM